MPLLYEQEDFWLIYYNIVIWWNINAMSLQSCPTLCDPIDGSPPGSPVPGILQARALEWVAISFSNSWKWKVKVKLLSRVRLLATPWTAAYQAPLPMGFSRQEYWSGVPLPSPLIQYTLVFFDSFVNRVIEVWLEFNTSFFMKLCHSVFSIKSDHPTVFVKGKQKWFSATDKHGK